jgi:hypothetical protein
MIPDLRVGCLVKEAETPIVPVKSEQVRYDLG